jgi:hypothetical protein
VCFHRPRRAPVAGAAHRAGPVAHVARARSHGTRPFQADRRRAARAARRCDGGRPVPRGGRGRAPSRLPRAAGAAFAARGASPSGTFDTGANRPCGGGTGDGDAVRCACQVNSSAMLTGPDTSHPSATDVSIVCVLVAPTATDAAAGRQRERDSVWSAQSVGARRRRSGSTRRPRRSEPEPRWRRRSSRHGGSDTGLLPPRAPLSKWCPPMQSWCVRACSVLCALCSVLCSSMLFVACTHKHVGMVLTRVITPDGASHPEAIDEFSSSVTAVGEKSMY